MTERNMTEGDLIAQLDQLATQFENMAELLATYYKSLIAKGVCDDLAQKLVLEFHHLWWLRVLNQSPLSTASE